MSPPARTTPCELHFSLTSGFSHQARRYTMQPGLRAGASPVECAAHRACGGCRWQGGVMNRRTFALGTVALGMRSLRTLANAQDYLRVTPEAGEWLGATPAE